MSVIKVAAIKCDSEYGCDAIEVTYFEGIDFAADWGIKTRDLATEHLCWGCVFAANEDEDHYLRRQVAEVSR